MIIDTKPQEYILSQGRAPTSVSPPEDPLQTAPSVRVSSPRADTQPQNTSPRLLALSRAWQGTKHKVRLLVQKALL